MSAANRKDLPKAKRFGFNGFVPFYDLSGNIEQIMSLKGVEGLYAGGLATLVRNRKGVIVRAYRTTVSRKANLTLKPYLGTSYSYRELLATGDHCSDLRRIGRKKRFGENDLQYAPEFLRPVFLRVVTDCLVIVEEPKPEQDADLPIAPDVQGAHAS